MVGDFGRFFALPLYKVTHWLIMSTIIDIPKFTRSSKNMEPTIEIEKKWRCTVAWLKWRRKGTSIIIRNPLAHRK